MNPAVICECNRATVSPWKGAKCHFFVISSFHGLFGSFLMDTVEKGFCPKNAQAHARS
jgi:hypothetical protein